MSNNGKFFIISAPSGTGKSTLIKRLMEEITCLKKPISYTTRKPRGHEKDGVDYHFVSLEEFNNMKNNGKFIEWAKVHKNFYATSLDIVQKSLASDEFLIKDIDTQGTAQLKQKLKEKAVTIFIKPPSPDELKKRLKRRGMDSDENIKIRLKDAPTELKVSNIYQHTVINDKLETTISELKTIINGHINND